MPASIDITPTSGTALYEVFVNENSLSKTVEITSISIDREVGSIPTATLNIIDGNAELEDFKHTGGDDFTPGNEIIIKAGWDTLSNTKPIFKGIIVKQCIRAMGNGYTGLVVEAQHVAYKLTLGRKSQVFSGKSDEGVVEQILKDNNIDATVDDDGIAHENIVQYNATDWDFLMTRVDASGKLLIAGDEEITVATPNVNEAATIDLGFGTTLLEFETTLDARTQPGKITVNRWVPSSDKAEQDEAQFTAPELGDLKANDLATTTGFAEDEIHFGGTTIEKKNMKSVASGRLMRARLAKIRGRGKVVGRAEIQPGITVNLKGMSDRMNGKAYVSGVRHTLRNGMWHADVQFGLNPKFHSERFNISSPPASAVMPAASGIQIGKVVDQDKDEKGLERIKVSLPVLGENVNIMARLGSIYTGDKRGFAFPPKAGDEVIIGFIDDDPGQAIILASLYNNADDKAAAIPTEKKDKRNRKGFFLDTNFSIEFDEDDSKKSLMLQTPDGRKITLDDKDGQSITLEDKKGNSIAMTSEGITIDTSNKLVLKGNEVEIDAKVDLKAKSSAQFEVSAPKGSVKGTGQLEIIGGIVDIN